MAAAARFSSPGEERSGEGRGVKQDPNHTQMMNKLVGTVMEKLAHSDPSKTFTPSQKNDVKRQLCTLLPVFKKPNHPTYAAMIAKAIKELNEEFGSTKESISKLIRKKFDSLPLVHESFFNHHLRKLIERGEIVHVSNNCYKLPAKKVDSLSRRERVPRQKQTKWKEYGQQSQVASEEEQNSKVINSQNGSLKQQNEPKDAVNKQQDDVNEEQLQENIVRCENQIDAKLKLKVANEHIEVCMDKVIEEHCQTNEQSCDVIEQHSQVVESDMQLHGEVVEAILTGAKAQQSDIISGRNRPQDQFELTSMQELLSKKQEKDVATLVNSDVSIASQKSSHHVSSILSELLENNIKVQEKTHKLLENYIEVQEKNNKLLEEEIKVQKMNHKLLANKLELQEKTLQVQEKTLQGKEKLFELLKELKDTNRNPSLEERPMANIGPCREREYIDCGFPAKKMPQPEISAQTKASESQLNEMSASLELPTDATELYLKQGKLNVCQQQVPECQNKSVKTHLDAEQLQEQEIGNSKRSWDIPTMEGENEELYVPVKKKICFRVDTNHDTEKQLQVHYSEVNPDLLGKQPSECQDEDHQAEKVIKEKAVQSSHLSLELTASEQSFQEYRRKRSNKRRSNYIFGVESQLRHGVAMAPEIQEEQQPRDPIQERMKVDHKLAEQRQLSPRDQRHSGSEMSLTTSMVESSPRKNDQNTERQTEEKTRELKTSAEETGQRQLQQRQLQPRTKNLSESKHSMLSNTGMPQVEKSGVKVSSQLKTQSQVEKPGVGDSSQPKQKQVDCSNKLTQKQQMPWDMKLHSRNQAASQCEPDVMMIESPSSKHPCEQPQEQKHPKQPHKQKGRPPKSKLERAAPAKRQKLQEQLERRGRPPKLDENTISGRELISKNKQKQAKSPGKAEPRTVTEGKLDSSEGKASKSDSRNTKEYWEGEGSKSD